MDELFQGAEINGKQFPFVRVTVAKQAKIIKRFNPGFFGRMMQILFPLRNNLRMWKRVRSVAFIKTGSWKYLRIIPKELRSSEISLKLAGELQASFFSYVGVEVEGHDKPLLSVTGLKTVNELTK